MRATHRETRTPTAVALALLFAPLAGFSGGHTPPQESVRIVASLTPYLRQSSVAGNPASCSLSMAMICPSEYLLRLMSVSSH